MQQNKDHQKDTSLCSYSIGGCAEYELERTVLEEQLPFVWWSPMGDKTLSSIVLQTELPIVHNFHSHHFHHQNTVEVDYTMSHCHDEHHSHGGNDHAGHDHTDDITPALQYSLYQHINFDGITTMNEATAHSGRAIIKKTWAERLSITPELVSDADEQILMHIPYATRHHHVAQLLT